MSCHSHDESKRSYYDWTFVSSLQRPTPQAWWNASLRGGLIVSAHPLLYLTKAIKTVL